MMQFMQNLYNKPSTSSSSLPSNIIPNPKEEAKAITTRSGMSYKEPPIPPTGVNQQEPVEVTTDMEPQNSDDIHLPTVQDEVQIDKPAEEPAVKKLKLPMLNDTKMGLEIANRTISKPTGVAENDFVKVEGDILILEALLNDDPEPPPSQKHYFPELADRTISKPTGVAENVFVNVGKFYFPADFVILDFVADPRVPLILGRPFLSTAHAIINVFEREIIIRQNQQSLTIQCSDIPSVKKIKQINKIEFINTGGINSESEEIEDFLNDKSIQF
nr:reverse transcriptase domain-containing protein [Tanacetum cinerariifolium]